MANLRDLISPSETRHWNKSDSIYMNLRTLIADGVLGEFEQLPSESELAELYRVSRTTIREALNKLQQEGTVIRKHGVGTFISPSHSLVSRLDVNLGGAELINSLGLTPGNRNICIKVIGADEKLSKKLDVNLGEELISVDRIQTANNNPVIYSIDVFPINFLTRVQKELDLNQLNELMGSKLSIYRIFEDFLGLEIDHGIATVHPTVAASVLPEKMAVSPDEFVLWIDQVNYNQKGNPILASEHFYISSVFTFTIFRKRM